MCRLWRAMVKGGGTKVMIVGVAEARGGAITAMMIGVIGDRDGDMIVTEAGQGGGQTVAIGEGRDQTATTEVKARSATGQAAEITVKI